MIQQIRKLAASLTPRQRWSILAAAVLVAAGLWGFARWRTESAFRPLYTGLEPEDAGAVVGKLKQANVDYRLGENGTAVLVPQDRLAELRLQMAVDGLPKTGRLGFEIFDQTNFGLTDFAEHVNYRRALEGELERSLAHLAEVEQARVHLTFPKDSVFLEARQPAKASVMLRLRSGTRLSPQSVQAICHLAASAVEGLAPEAVSVLDTRGNLLNRPRPAGEGEGLAPSEAALDYRRQIERDLTLKVRATLEPLLGSDHFQATVAVDCDLTSGEHSEELFDPARSVMLTSQRSEDTTAGTSTAGVPGTASNLPRPPAGSLAGRTGMSRRTENITYQSSRTVRRTRQPQGEVRRVSVAVLVDQDLQWEGAPPHQRRVLVPPPPAKLQAIRDLVAGAVNFQAARGDQIIVESLPFDATLRAAPPPADPPVAPGAPWLVNPRLVLLGAAAVLILLSLAGAVWYLGRRGRRAQPSASVPTALPQAPSGSPLEQAESQIAAQAADGRELAELEILRSIKMPENTTKKAEVLSKHLRETINKDPDPAVTVLRGWLNR